MAVIKEKDILKRLEISGLSDTQKEAMVREAIEKMGVDFGRTVYCRGAHPNREWTNRSEEFEISPEEAAAVKAAQQADEKEARDKVIREEAEKMMKDKELADLKAELAALKGTPSIEGTLHLDKRTREFKESQKTA